MKSLSLLILTLFSVASLASAPLDISLFGANQDSMQVYPEQVLDGIAYGYAINALGLTDNDVEEGSLWNDMIPANDVIQGKDGMYYLYLIADTTGDCVMQVVVKENGTVFKKEDLTEENRNLPVTSTRWSCI